jgi:hypothetical protein
MTLLSGNGGQLNMLGFAPSGAPTPRPAPLSAAQRAVLDLARRTEGVRAVEAGMVLHDLRNGGRGCRPNPRGYPVAPLPASNAADRWTGTRSVACCPWASSDGSELLKRLRDRGLVEQRATRGPWHLTGGAA